MSGPTRCHNCGKGYARTRRDQVTCSSRCNNALTNREAVRGRRVVRALVDWRLRQSGPNADKEQARLSFAWLCREVKAWAVEDAERQRPISPPHDHLSDRGHQRRPTRGPEREPAREHAPSSP